MKTPPSIPVTQLTLQDKEALATFFLALKSKTLFYWNRFGTSFSLESARKIAAEQVHRSVKEEAGFVVYRKEKLAGYSYLRFFPEKPQKSGTASLGMVVRDDFQNQGIGSALMEAMIAYCQRAKMKKIWLATYTDNAPTQPFYRKFGFISEGIFMFDEYFKNKPRHVLSMAKFLDAENQREAVKLKKRYL